MYTQDELGNIIDPHGHLVCSPLDELNSLYPDWVAAEREINSLEEELEEARSEIRCLENELEGTK